MHSNILWTQMKQQANAKQQLSSIKSSQQEWHGMLFCQRCGQLIKIHRVFLILYYKNFMFLFEA